MTPARMGALSNSEMVSSLLAAAAKDTDPSSTLWQFAATVTLSLFTFFLFKLKNRFRELSLLCMSEDHLFCSNSILKAVCVFITLIFTLAFALIMKDLYTPAVFTMAIIAIVVAADHDMELEEARDHIKETSDELSERLKKQLEVNTQSLFDGVDEKVQRLAQLTESHTWANVVEKWDKPYKSYIVVKHWEVPEEVMLNMRTDHLNFNEFFSIRTQISEKDPCMSAFRTMQGLIESSERTDDPLRRSAYLRFVTPGPLRVRRTMSEFPEDASGQDTRYFYGLLYTMCCLYRASLFDSSGSPIARPRVRPARIRIGHAPLWVHVLGPEVWQMVETRMPSRALSRPLHDEVANFSYDRQGDSTYVPGVKAWSAGYANIIQGSYDRASRAERYIASIFLSAQGEKVEKGDVFCRDYCITEQRAFCLDLAYVLGGKDNVFAFHALSDITNGDLSIRSVRTLQDYFATSGNSGQLFLSKNLYISLASLIREYIVLRYLYVSKVKGRSLEESLASILNRDSSINVETAFRFLLNEVFA